MIRKFRKNGFTLIEILVVIGIMAILATVVIIAINPGRQFAQARNTQRVSNVNAILNAIGQNIADNKGIFNCTNQITNVPTVIQNPTGLDIYNCLIPNYISQLPIDPQVGYFKTPADYNSGYQVSLDSNTNRITVNAPQAEIGASISITR